MTRIAVTGATGHIGSRVARGLVSETVGDELTVRLIVRDPARAPRIDGTEIAVAEYRDGDAAQKALEGVDVLFMVSAHESADRVHEHVTFINAAARAGVRHIVYTSFVGAGDSAGFTLARDHGATEAAIRDSEMDYTFLRDNFYLDLLPEFADQNGVIRGPAGDGVTAAVARADVADVATAVLLHPDQHLNVIYELTGGEALNFGELARRASAATGKPFTFVNETLEEAFASRSHYGAPDWQVEAWVSTYTAIADGELARVTHDVQTIAGHAPRTLEDVLSNR
ncbi:SDR family oxidoreductase [Leifsonia sp. A12D58]|uniref:SDR family oxidoreductase n=1 Tax=Leifsonia sp. A12D58 TaxID=3397674 RepID=UPI0039E0AC6E